MHCVVTGGAGFIGSHLCERLLTLGHDVACLDDLSAGRLENIAGLISHPHFMFFPQDVCGDITDMLYGADVLFHLAASKKNVCLRDPARDLAVNAGGTLNLLQTAVQCGVKQFIYASTGSVYGNTPVQEETAPTIPVSYYGISKLAGEGYVRIFADKLHTVVLRYFHVYGPRQEAADHLGGVIAIFMRRLYHNWPLTVYGDGQQWRCFTYVDDVINANLAALEMPSGTVCNCVSDVHITLNMLIEKLFALTGRSVPVKYEDWQVGDIVDFAPHNSRIKNFGATFQDIDAGLQKTWKHYIIV